MSITPDKYYQIKTALLACLDPDRFITFVDLLLADRLGDAKEEIIHRTAQELRNKQYYNSADAAAIMNMSVERARDLMRTGQLKSYREGDRYVTKWQHIQEYMEQQCVWKSPAVTTTQSQVVSIKKRRAV